MNYIDYIVIAAYILFFLYLGMRFKDNSSAKDYFLGGKSFGWIALALSTAATQLSAISFISAPTFVGLKQGGGMMWLTYEFAVPLAMLFLMVFLIPPLYKSGIVSVYGYLEKRFSASTRVILSTVFQISRAFATGVMVYTVAIILKSVLEIELWQTIGIIGAVTLIYSYQGGMKAVVYGDVIQMVILLIGIVICLYYGLHYIGGWESFVEKVDRERLQAVKFDSMGLDGDEFGFWPMLLGGFFLYVSYYGTDQSQAQRLFSAKSLGTVKATLLTNGLMRFPITFLYCLMGLVIGTYVMTSPEFLAKIPSDKPDYMIPIFIRDYLPNGLIGILIVAIFSAAMSSLSSAINSLSAASVEDLFNRNKQLDSKTYVRYSRYAALFWGVFCLLAAFLVEQFKGSTVIEIINKIGSIAYGPILATFIAAVAIKRINSIGANIGLLAGVAVNMYLWKFVPEIFWFWWNFIGTAVTLIVGYLSSLAFPPQEHDSLNLLDHKFEFDVKRGLLLIGFFILIVIISVNVPNLF